MLLLGCRPRKCSEDFLKKAIPDLNVQKKNKNEPVKDVGNLGVKRVISPRKRDERAWGWEGKADPLRPRKGCLWRAGRWA